MTTNACCHAARHDASPKRRWFAAVEWAVPGAVLALLPKCPACLAAYVALWTGIGMSFTTAKYVRVALLAVSLATIVYLAARTLGRRVVRAART